MRAKFREGIMKKYLLRLMCFVILAAFLCGCGKESGNSEVQPTGDGNEAEAVGSQVKEGSGEHPPMWAD